MTSKIEDLPIITSGVGLIVGVADGAVIAPGKDGRWYVLTGNGSPEDEWVLSFPTEEAARGYMMEPRNFDGLSAKEMSEEDDKILLRYGGRPPRGGEDLKWKERQRRSE